MKKSLKCAFIFIIFLNFSCIITKASIKTNIPIDIEKCDTPAKKTSISELIEEINNSTLEKNEVKIGVIDSGITDFDYFDNRRLIQYDKSFVNAENTVADEYDHGTSVSYIITNMTPKNVKIITYKIFDKNGYTTIARICNALLQAKKDNCDIVNLSLSGQNYSQNIEDALIELVKNKCIPVVASGNKNKELVDSDYPASSNNVICVSSISNKKVNGKYERSAFSNYGKPIDFSAQGESLFILHNNNYFCGTYGTSFACPIVTSYIALLKSFDKEISLSQSKELLKKFISSDFSEDYEQNQNYHDDKYGYGYLDFSNVHLCDKKEKNCKVLYHQEPYEITIIDTLSKIQTKLYFHQKEQYHATLPLFTRDGYELKYYVNEKGEKIEPNDFVSPGKMTLYSIWKAQTGKNIESK